MRSVIKNLSNSNDTGRKSRATKKHLIIMEKYLKKVNRRKGFRLYAHKHKTLLDTRLPSSPQKRKKKKCILKEQSDIPTGKPH